MSVFRGIWGGAVGNEGEVRMGDLGIHVKYEKINAKEGKSYESSDSGRGIWDENQRREPFEAEAND